MKELFRSKGMVGFLVIIVSLTIFSAKPNDSKINLDSNDVNINYNI